MHWSTVPIHIIDFEGTKTSGILEYGVVTLHQNKIVQTHTRLCQPTGAITDQDIRQHGITLHSVQSALPFSSEWSLFSELRSTGPLGAHHAHTENMLLKNSWPYPRSSPDFLNLNESSISWGPWIDTCQLFKTIYPQLETHKLIDLIHIFRLNDQLDELSQKYCPPSRIKPHCALYDALASVTLLSYLTSLSDFKNVSLQWLLINSAAKKKSGQMKQPYL